MLLAFDLDGTLVDTKEAVTEAYKTAFRIVEGSLDNMPEDFFGKPASAWLKNPEVYRVKKLLYPDFLRRLAKPLPLAKLYSLEGGMILTGASIQAAQEVLIACELPPWKGGAWGCTTRDKVEMLNAVETPGIYFDDDLEASKQIAKATNWEVVCTTQFS